MTFLEPLMLAATPLVLLPIIIHFFNRRRYRTIQWAAMMFLATASRMSRGYTRLRQWLILAARMLAVAGLIFAISRPVMSGMLGVALGGRTDSVVVLFDRSPSMCELGPGTGRSKLETGRSRLAGMLSTLGTARSVLIDSANLKPLAMDSRQAVQIALNTEPVSAAADIPSLLQAAFDYVRAANQGPSEIWICSDLRANDWCADSARWPVLRDGFHEFAATMRFRLLAYSRAASGNIALRVTDVRRRPTSDGANLLLTIHLQRTFDAADKASIPIEFEIESARSTLAVELVGAELTLKDYAIPLEREKTRGWGRVSIPSDTNPADNEFYFVFEDTPPLRTIIVAEDAEAARAMQLCAAIPAEPALRCSAEVVPLAELATVDWQEVALLLWQAQLPSGSLANRAESYLDAGGQAIFMPPGAPDSTEFLGVRWKTWVDEPTPRRVETWRDDSDLLRDTESGASLPVGELAILRHCTLEGPVAELAALRGDALFFGRAANGRAGAYFCATTPAPANSTLGTGGIVLYAIVQRALRAGAEALGDTRMLDAGAVPAASAPLAWRRIAGSSAGLSTEYSFRQGVYGADDRLVAINRPAAEDAPAVLADSQLAALFEGLDFARMDDDAGSTGALAHEVWRLFLASMIAALLLEACLSLPKAGRADVTPS